MHIISGVRRLGVIVCPRCSKENQDHYKFCLGCGAELPRNAAHQPKSFTAPTPPAGMGAGTASVPPGMPGALGRGFGGPAAPDAPTQVAPNPDAAAPGGARGSTPARASGDMLTCPKCGAAVPKNFKFCGSCGHGMNAVAATPSAPASGRTAASWKTGQGRGPSATAGARTTDAVSSAALQLCCHRKCIRPPKWGDVG